MVKSFKPHFTKKDSAGKKDAGAEQFEPITKYMATDLITFTPETNVIEVIRTFLKNKISGAPVLNEKKEVVGLIDDKDCLRLLIDSVYHNEPIANVKVQSYMTSVMKIIDVSANVVDAAKIFLETKYKRLLVINEDGKLIGQISRQDILEAIDTIYVPKWKSKT
jgi:CBS domain-containing protein